MKRLPQTITESTPHGSTSTYTNYRCRCADCREAWRVGFAASRLRREARLATLPDAAHGKVSTYCNWRCRCDACRAGWAAYNRSRRAVRVES